MGDDDGGKVEEVKVKAKAFFESAKEFYGKASVKFEDMCVKLDENLPRKSYIFLALTFAVISSLLQLLF